MPDSGTMKTPVDGWYPLPALVLTRSKTITWFPVASASGMLEDNWAKKATVEGVTGMDSCNSRPVLNKSTVSTVKSGYHPCFDI